ncbi:2,3,4,5-tetrahydropyridine-2,6-dicarboxylate N-succinyltransferase [Bermanella sp. 47_1433_sub80_T6]|nr:2,3,4,5-tetrahydropyridine-2,6-dicarboxylate N-succinyltransferase [Bermanella sp. 47_1433_sub80_T6]
MALAFALGVGTQNSKNEWLEVFYQKPVFQPAADLVEAAKAAGYTSGNQAIELNTEKLETLSAALTGEQAALAKTLTASKAPTVLVVLESDEPSQSTPEVYLKLQLISHRLVKPHGIDLSGMFGLLPNVAWTSKGAIDLAEISDAQLQARMQGEVLEVFSVDKFPKMTDYVVPSGVRIADAGRVRLGAYAGEGTTIMHEGFINFNAGTEGTSMVEGRISAGVMVGKGSDLGGGCSTMGTLSGGGNIIIKVGENSLIGANAGIGIPLGDRCTVESGLYITAGTKIQLLDADKNVVEVVKARDLANKPDLLFRRDSISGAVQCVTNKTAIELNSELHANN